MNIALVQAPPLAHALASKCAPPGVRVTMGLAPNDPMRLPMAVVSTSAPSSVSNGPNEASARFTISIRCYADSRQQALDLSLAMYAGLHRLWRQGEETPYGWLSHISSNSLQPQQVASDIEADDSHRFDIALQVTARNLA